MTAYQYRFMPNAILFMIFIDCIIEKAIVFLVDPYYLILYSIATYNDTTCWFAQLTDCSIKLYVSME